MRINSCSKTEIGARLIQLIFHLVVRSAPVCARQHSYNVGPHHISAATVDMEEPGSKHILSGKQLVCSKILLLSFENLSPSEITKNSKLPKLMMMKTAAEEMPAIRGTEKSEHDIS